MMKRQMAWSFKSDLKLRQMMNKLNPLWFDEWIEGDSSYHDFIAGQLNKEGVARIYKKGDGFVVNLVFLSKQDEATAELIDAQTVLLTKVLPIVGARDVAPTDVYE